MRFRLGNKHDDDILERMESAAWNMFTKREQREMLRVNMFNFFAGLGWICLLVVISPAIPLILTVRKLRTGKWFA